MDIFVEQIIKKKFEGKDWLILAGVTVAGAILLFLDVFVLFPLMPMLPIVPLLVFAGIIYGAYWVLTSRFLEYEYSVTNGDITIDKIINRRRRKRVASFDAHDIEEMGKYNAAKLGHRQFEQRFFAGESESGADCWYFSCRHPKLGNSLVVFSPNEKVLNSIKPFLKHQVRNDAFGRN